MPPPEPGSPTGPRLPVTPGATDGARELLELLYALPGTALLSGQHNQPVHGSSWTERITALTGATPALWGGEIGFSAPGTLDGVDRRGATIAEAIAWHSRGAVITTTWHAVCPLDDEPVPFEGGVLRDLDPADYDAVLDTDSDLHARWVEQVNVAADFLLRLQDAGVPVLLRPYHEMNGAWFWWGGQPQRFARLWRMLFDHLVRVRGLRNLVWLWNPNAAYGDTPPVEPCYPGHDVVDALAVDVYGSRFDQQHQDGLLALADGRPIGLGEVGGLPSPEVLDTQPAWAWYMAWPDVVTAETDAALLRRLPDDPRVLDLPGLVRWRSRSPAAAAP